MGGFGDPHNCYAYSCGWYDDHVYIGTFRDALALVKLRTPYEVRMPFWPVPVPESIWEMDLCAQIWRYSPLRDEWQRVYRAPMVPGREGRDVPLSVGFRNMAIFQGKSDPRPAIYTVTFSSSQGWGPVLLRSIDGVHFEEASEPGLGLGDPNLRSFRGVVPFKGRLFATPAGSGGGNVNVSYNVVILCTDDPVRGRWEASNQDAFGDPTNLTVFEMAVFDDHLYAATLNVRQGFQLWKTDGEGPPPHRWTKVLDCGADRGPLNQGVCGMAAFNGALYLGTGIQGGGFDRVNGVGPAASELIRVYPDGTWDLVVGEPRLSRMGPQFPTSGLGPGFDNFFAGYFWRVGVHDGAIYVGTFDWTCFLPYTPTDEWPEALRRVMTPEVIEMMVDFRGGAELWRSGDGDRWTPVTINGMSNRYNYGIRSILSTPHGLFVGTANPFGPQVAVRKAGRWIYEDNPQGGVEVWHGSLEHRGGVGSQAGTAGREGKPRWHHDDGATPESGAMRLIDERRLSEHSDRLPPSIRSRSTERRSDPLLDSLVSYSAIYGEAAYELELPREPLLRLAGVDRDLIPTPETVEDEMREFYADAPLHCVGYWHDESVTPRRACLDLFDQLLALLTGDDEAVGTESAGTVAVDEADDASAAPTTSLRQDSMVGVVAADADSAAGALRELQPDRPDLVFKPLAIRDSRWRGWRLNADDEALDAVIWIEGPSASDRATALAEARRVLKPGGKLVAADLITSPLDEPTRVAPSPAPSTQPVQDAYRDALAESGYSNATLIDATAKTWLRFYRQSRKYFFIKLLFQLLEDDRYRAVIDALPGGGRTVDCYLLLSAKKTQEQTT